MPKHFFQKDGECDEFEELIITVTPETRMVEFELDGQMIAVNTRVGREMVLSKCGFRRRWGSHIGESRRILI